MNIIRIYFSAHDIRKDDNVGQLGMVQEDLAICPGGLYESYFHTKPPWSPGNWNMQR